MDTSGYRAVHLCHPAAFGGLESVVQGLGKALQGAGHEVEIVAVVSPTDDVSPFISPLQGAGVPVHLIRCPPRRYLREIREVRERILTLRPQVLHTHGYRADILHSTWARRAGLRLVTTMHGYSKMGGMTGLWEWLQLRFARHFDAVIAVSSELSRHLVAQGIPKSRIHVIPNAWIPPQEPLGREDARKALGLSEEVLVIGWVGRLVQIKDCDLFLKALTELNDHRPWHAAILGDGPERTRLENLAKTLELGGRVTFFGAVPDAGRFMSAFDLLALTSKSEGTPMSLLEAMGSGIPVVATSVGGVPALLGQARTGWLVPPGDPEHLAKVLRNVLTEDRIRVDAGTLAREHIRERYSLSEWARKTALAYS